MKTGEKKINVFIAEGGKEFTDKEQCLEYESVLSEMRKIKFFRISQNPDLTETGMYYSHNYAAVYVERNCYHKEVLMQYLINSYGGELITESVQGCSVQPLFLVTEIDRLAYDNATPNKWGGRETDTEKYFLSEREFPTMPAPIKFLSKHIRNYKA